MATYIWLDSGSGNGLLPENTNVDLSLMRFWGMNIRAFSREVPTNSIRDMK